MLNLEVCFLVMIIVLISDTMFLPIGWMVPWCKPPMEKKSSLVCMRGLRGGTGDPEPP